MNNKFTLSILFLMLFSMIGCSSTQPLNQSSISTSTAPLGYPIEIPQSTDGYPAPEKMDQKMVETLTAFDLPAPVSGKASISGVLVNYSSSTLMKNVDIYLTKAIGPDHIQMPAILAGAFEDIGDIKGKTDENGQFIFSNIPPANYFLIVAMDLSPVTSVNATTIPFLIQALPDTNSNLGIVYYNLN